LKGDDLKQMKQVSLFKHFLEEIDGVMEFSGMRKLPEIKLDIVDSSLSNLLFFSILFMRNQCFLSHKTGYFLKITFRIKDQSWKH